MATTAVCGSPAEPELLSLGLLGRELPGPGPEPELEAEGEVPMIRLPAPVIVGAAPMADALSLVVRWSSCLQVSIHAWLFNLPPHAYRGYDDAFRHRNILANALQAPHGIVRANFVAVAAKSSRNTERARETPQGPRLIRAGMYGFDG